MGTRDHPYPSKKIKREYKKKSRGYVFTLHNYTQDHITNIQALVLNDLIDWMVVEEEVGELGAIHLQGAIHLTNPRAADYIKSRIDIHKDFWMTDMKGTKADQVYCTKDLKVIAIKNYDPKKERVSENEIKLSWVQLDPLEKREPLPWQKDLLEKILPYQENRREIIYIRDEQGHAGKSVLRSHLEVRHDALCVSGNEGDMFYAISQLKETGKRAPRFLCLDIPRNDFRGVRWGGLESFKDGSVFSTKFKSVGVQFREVPTILIFGNFWPPKEALSKDRWTVYDLHWSKGSPTGSPEGGSFTSWRHGKPEDIKPTLDQLQGIKLEICK